MLDRAELRNLLAKASASTEFKKRIKNPKTGADFLLAAQIPGSDIQKKITQLLLSIRDEKEFILAMTRFLAQLNQLTQLKTAEEQRLIRRYLRNEEEHFERIEFLLQRAKQEEQRQRSQLEFADKPLTFVEQQKQALSVELTNAVEKFEKAKQQFIEATSRFEEAAGEADDIRQEVFESVRDELDIDDEELEAIQEARQAAPSIADLARITQGNTKASVVSTTDSMRDAFALQSSVSSTGRFNPFAAAKRANKIAALIAAQHNPEFNATLATILEKVNSRYVDVDSTGKAFKAEGLNVREILQKIADFDITPEQNNKLAPRS